MNVCVICVNNNNKCFFGVLKKCTKPTYSRNGVVRSECERWLVIVRMHQAALWYENYTHTRIGNRPFICVIYTKLRHNNNKSKSTIPMFHVFRLLFNCVYVHRYDIVLIHTVKPSEQTEINVYTRYNTKMPIIVQVAAIKKNLFQIVTEVEQHNTHRHMRT